jgi:hypothetical protein
MRADDYFDRSRLGRATSEEDFDRAAADLLDAVVEEANLIAGLLPSDGEKTRSWNRDEAVCAGLIVRCSKLLRAYADHFRAQEFEVCNYLMRGILESLVNAFFLTRFGTAAMLERFRALSFRGDKDLLKRIEGNVEERQGLVLPIEERISAAIGRRLAQAGVDLEEVPTGGRERWGGTDKEKLEALGIEDLYQPLFIGPSAYIHGTWHELVMYHLRYGEDGKYDPSLDFSAVRPQYALSLCRMTSEVLAEYADDRFAGLEKAVEANGRLEAIREAAEEVDQLHENYIGRTGGPELAF